MNAEPMDAMEMRATAQQYTGPSAGRIANRIPHAVGFERGWFRTTTAVCHGGESDGLAFRQRPDGNGIDVRCHTGGCTRGHIVTALEGLARSARARHLQRTRLARHRGSRAVAPDGHGGEVGAGEGIRTLDPLPGKQGLYRSRCTST